MIVPTEEFVTMLLVIANLDLLEPIVQSVHALINALLKENVLTGLVFAMLDLWEMIVHLRDAKVVADLINIVMMALAHATQVTLEPTVISELAPMIVSVMVIASTDHAIVVLVGLVMIVH